jgi:threonine dehydrogenase-like Zn-dependent dehydrogenase
VLLCGDTLGTPYHALRRLGGVDPDLTAAVFGFGPIGMGFLTWLKFHGVRTIVSEISPYRRALAESLGADVVLDPTCDDVVSRIREETSGGADLCLDCTETQETLTHALNAARVHGRVGWIGEKPEATLNPSEQVIHRELYVAGSWYFTVDDFGRMVDCLRRGLEISQLITHRYDLLDAPRAFELFLAGETGKVIFCHEGAG